MLPHCWFFLDYKHFFVIKCTFNAIFLLFFLQFQNVYHCFFLMFSIGQKAANLFEFLLQKSCRYPFFINYGYIIPTDMQMNVIPIILKNNLNFNSFFVLVIFFISSTYFKHLIKKTNPSGFLAKFI